MRAVLLFVAVLTAAAQSTDRVTIPFSNPGGPKKVRVSTINGSISIRGYDGNEVIVESKGGSGRRGPSEYQGLKRIDSNSGGFTAEEQDNTIRVEGSPMGGGDLDLQVPRNVSLSAKALNNGKLTIVGLNGEIEAHNLNGPVDISEVGGSVLAHSLNGAVRVSVDRIDGDKPMSFSTLNGNIDVTLPAATKARLKMKSDNGDVFSDFEIKLETSGASVVEQGQAGKGKYKVKVDRSVFGTINGGGPLYSFTTLNGKILLRKK